MRELMCWLGTAALLAVTAGCGRGGEPQANEPQQSAGFAMEDDAQGWDDASQPQPQAQASASGPLASVQIIDPSGFGQPMVASTIQIPSNWHTQGGVQWDRSSECVANHLRMNWLASSPDGREAFEIMPGYSWQLQGTDIQMNPCPPLGIRTTQQFLETVAQRYPGVRVLGYRERNDLITQPQQPGNGARLQVSAGELLIAYQGNAGEVRERLITALNISEVQGNVVINSPLVYAYRAVGRDPQEGVSERFFKSMQPNPQWMAQVTQTSNQLVAQIAARQRQNIDAWHASEMAKINARGAADRAQIRMQTQREVAQIYSNTWANSQATDDRIQRRTLESIGGYNTYADPAGGGVVRESTQYERVLRNSDGSYLSTNDPYLNPAGSEELQRIP